VRPVVLLHGFAGSYERTWRQPGMAELLADVGRTVVGIDLLGHGDAPKPHDPAAYAQLPALVRAEVDAASPDEPVDVVAFSLGAQTVLGLAAEAPERFGQLIVAGIGARTLEVRDPELVAQALEAPPDPENEVGRHFRILADVPGNDMAALAACLRRPHEPLSATLLASVSNEVVVAVGDRDELAGPGQPIVDALPHARLVTLSRTDHSGTPESFAFIDLVLEVLGT
jgi:pimeloyl-ACP methyl ester carboxylesterase